MTFMSIHDKNTAVCCSVWGDSPPYREGITIEHPQTVNDFSAGK
jgi:hypothetical protein